jgi:hypothetical protein
MAAPVSMKLVVTAFVSAFAGHRLIKAIKQWIEDRGKYDGLDGKLSLDSASQDSWVKERF